MDVGVKQFLSQSKQNGYTHCCVGVLGPFVVLMHINCIPNVKYAFLLGSLANRSLIHPKMSNLSVTN